MNRTLCDLRPGEHATVRKLLTQGSMRRRILDLGLIENTDVECISQSPGGDLSAFMIRGAVIAIRAEDLKGICIK